LDHAGAVLIAAQTGTACGIPPGGNLQNSVALYHIRWLIALLLVVANVPFTVEYGPGIGIDAGGVELVIEEEICGRNFTRSAFGSCDH
jgi:hypothetical protein